MKKNNFLLFSIILALLFSILLFTGVERAKALDTKPQASQGTSFTKTGEPKVKTIPEKNLSTLSQIDHLEKKSFKYNLFKFFTAMFGVLVSALAIFFGLKVYKKFVFKNMQPADKEDFEKSLNSPKDFKEAINLFLGKTEK